MPDTAIPPASDYDVDWYAWTQEQAERLRALPAVLRSNGLDIEHLAEEVEDLGRSQRRAVRSLLRQIFIHLLKIEFHPAIGSHEHWMDEVEAFRSQIEDEFADSPSLRSRRAEIAQEAWGSALREVANRQRRGAPEMLRAIEASGLQLATPRYATDAELLRPGWYPLGDPG